MAQSSPRNSSGELGACTLILKQVELDDEMFVAGAACHELEEDVRVTKINPNGSKWQEMAAYCSLRGPFWST